MSWAVRMKLLCNCRYAQDLARTQIKLANALHSTPTATAKSDSDISENLLAVGSVYLKGDREKIEQNSIDRKAALNASDLVGIK